MREEEREGKRRGEKGEREETERKERAITLVILYRASRPDSLLLSVKYK